MGDLLTYFSITGLVNAVLSLGFALYLTITSWHVRIARYLVYLCLALGSWSVGYFLWQISTTHDTALFWSRGLMVGAIFTSISFLHLVIVFLGLDKIRFYKILLVLFYIPCIVWEILNFTPLFVAGVAPQMFFKFWPVPGPFYIFFLILFGVHVIISSGLLYRKYKHSTGLEKKQTLMLLIGITATFIGGSTNYFLWYNIPIPPWGNGVASAYAILSVYAIMRYGFLNARVVVAEIFTGLLLILSLINLVLSDDQSRLFLNFVSFVLVAFFSFVLVRSVHQEVKRRDEVIHLVHSLERANIRLQELDKQKTEFLSIAAHQLRTPLSVLKGYIELIADGAYGKVGAKIIAVLRDMDTSNEHLIKLVDEFLDISRIEQGRTKFVFKEVNPNKIINDVANELKEKADIKGMKIKWKEIKELNGTIMDEEKIHHVVYNYVDNALKYADKGEVEIVLEREEDGTVIRVKDQGVGFGKNDEANFFQKFFRGDNVKGMNVNGTGLGLYVCRKFIEAHNGRIWAHSRGLGKGSEFGFWIPLKQQ